jgi:hypothetical protein
LKKAPYYIVIKRTNQVLLSFLKVRVIVNNRDIYPLSNSQPVIIPVQVNHPKLVVTDGFHFARPMELNYDGPGYYRFNVECAINDLQLLGGAFFLVLFYLWGFFSGWFFLKAAAFVPILLFIFYYYIKRKQFIKLTPVKQ